MMRLSQESLGQLEPDVKTPSYDRSAVGVGIMHLGPSAFHRGHQAAYLDKLLAQNLRGWGICGVSIRSSKIRDLLVPQNFLYTLAIRDVEPSCRIIGSIFEMLSANSQQCEILDKFENPSLHIVSMTITEKGYCLTPAGDLDVANPSIQHDLENRQMPVSAIGYLVEGLARRQKCGLAPFTALSCDNLVGNGERLAKAVLQFAHEVDPPLAKWIDGNASFPNTMVDSITPATTQELLTSVAGLIGLEDAAPIQREAFTQWVIEDDFCDGRPPLEDVGVTFTNDVAPFEQAKLRILNGLHSTMAYVGFLRGHETVAESMADAMIKDFLQHLAMSEILPSLELADLGDYVDSILRRFENPAIEYQLLQIAGDSSQKIIFRLMGTVRDNLEAGRSVNNLAVGIAAWLHYARRQTAADKSLNDPQEVKIEECAKACSGNARSDVMQFAGLSETLAPDLMSSEQFVAPLVNAYKLIERGHLAELLARR